MPARPHHLRPELIGLVFVGGALGTVARYGLSLVVPSVAGWPWSTFLVNIVGAFVLGLLLETLLQRGPDEGLRLRLRIAAGPGVLGGFTTYSTLAVDTETLGSGTHLVLAVVYPLASLVLGVLAALAGIWAASLLTRTDGAR